MSTSPTAQVLAQWDEWSGRCTDRLFELDLRVTAMGTDEDRLDIAAVFVARKAIVERIEAMRAASLRDASAAAPLAGAPLVDDQGARVADDLTSAATLVDAIIGRIERHLDEHEATQTAIVQALTELDVALAKATSASERLGSHVNHVADLRTRRATVERTPVAVARLRDEARSVSDELQREDQERTDVLAALPLVPARLEALRAREVAVRSLVEIAREKVRPLPNLAVPSVDALGELPDVTDLPWSAARARLQPHLARIDRMDAALDEVERRFQAVLDRRTELRGLLQAYRDKAGARRLAEDPRLEERYATARDLLWSAPCDVAAAEPLVSAYAEAVNDAVDAIIAGRGIDGRTAPSDAAPRPVTGEGS